MCRNKTGSKKINRSSEVVKETWKGTEHWSLHPLPWASEKLRNLKKLTVRFPEILILKSGLLIARGRVLSREGLETTWSISHLSFFLAPMTEAGQESVWIPEKLCNAEIPCRGERFHLLAQEDLASPYIWYISTPSMWVRWKTVKHLPKAQAQSSLHPRDLCSTHMLAIWAWTRNWSQLLTSNSVVSSSLQMSRVLPTPWFNRRYSEFIGFI